MKRRLPKSFYNTTTLAGVVISVSAFALIVFLYMLELFAGVDNPYLGLVSFVALPVVLLLGIFVSAVGLIRSARRARRGAPDGDLPVLDLNKPRHRYALLFIIMGGLFLVGISGFGSYQVYEYTESVEFCGQVCHSVMKPEYVAYQHSPHAKVPCVECHIGSGAEWYVKSKLTGAYQVYSTIFKKYHRPIETPIANLRSAKETCAECHWPQHQYGQKLVDRSYFLSDEANTAYQAALLMKVGGSKDGTSPGIHAHMYLDNEISYIATDRQRQVIPYVESRSKDGTVTVYRSTEAKITDAQIRTGERRLVDCIDCHNRPAHVYNHPATSVNQAMAKGWIDPLLPEIKRLAVESLEKLYKTEAEAVATIRKDILAYYQETYPAQMKDKRSQLDLAIGHVQRIYKENYFPEMKTDWRAFPNNLDHLHNSGCFRCHDDKHVSSSGRVISKDCQSCHTLLSQKSAGGKSKIAASGLVFEHPMDVGDAWKEGLCKDCHGKQE